MCVVQPGSVFLSVCPLTVFCGWVLFNSAAVCPNSPCLSATYRRAALVLAGQFPLTFTPDWAGCHSLFQILEIISHQKGFITKSLNNMRLDIKRACFIDICFKDVWVILFRHLNFSIKLDNWLWLSRYWVGWGNLFLKPPPLRGNVQC